MCSSQKSFLSLTIFQIYDSDIFRLSSCQPENVLMPVLIKEKVGNNIEKWWFNLEEIPTSCICSLKLDPLN